MEEVRLSPQEFYPLLTAYSKNPSDPQVAAWQTNRVVVDNSIKLTEAHTKLPPGLVVEGNIDARKAAIHTYANLKTYGSIDLTENKHVLSVKNTAEILGSDTSLLDNPTADDLRHAAQSRKNKVNSPGILSIDKIPHTMDALEPKTTSFVTFSGTQAKSFDSSSVGTELAIPDLRSTRTQMDTHFRGAANSAKFRPPMGTKISDVAKGRNATGNIPGVSVEFG